MQSARKVLYLVVLHFLLGKSRHPVDVETAHLATRYAEFHLESTREMLQAYDRSSVERVRKIVEVRSALKSKGQVANARNIQRRLGKAMRAGLTADVLNSILEVLDRVDLGEPFPETFEGQQARADVIVGRLETLQARLARNERKRNERRLRNLRNAFRAARGPDRHHDEETAGEQASPAIAAGAADGPLSTGTLEPDGDPFESMFGFRGGEDEEDEDATILPFPAAVGARGSGAATPA